MKKISLIISIIIFLVGGVFGLAADSFSEAMAKALISKVTYEELVSEIASGTTYDELLEQYSEEELTAAAEDAGYTADDLSALSDATDLASALESVMSTLINGVSSDFGLLLDGVSSDIDCVLVQNAMTGRNIGMAELGDSLFYIGLPSISFTAANGFLTFRDNEDYFDLIDFNDIINDQLLSLISGSEYSQYVDLLLDKAFPIPSFKFATGFKLPFNLEFSCNGIYIPNFGVDYALYLLGENGIEVPDMEFNYINIGGVLRYVILRDSEITPGLSIGAGFYYNKVNFNMPLSDYIGDLMGDDSSSFSSLLSDLSIDFYSQTITFGLEASVSKRLLGFFIPYARFGSWYGITSTGGTIVLVEETDDDEGSKVTSEVSNSGFNFICDAGFDLALGVFIINVNGNYNISTGIWGADIGARFQF